MNWYLDKINDMYSRYRTDKEKAEFLEDTIEEHNLGLLSYLLKQEFDLETLTKINKYFTNFDIERTIEK